MNKTATNPVKIFMTGDVMAGRGIDQILPHPNPPNLYEPYMNSAEGYVKLAEEVNGRIPKPVDYSYIWGDALIELARMKPDVKLINLETAVTKNEDYEPKGINYRMNPENILCITAAGIDCCSLANNHVLDWGCSGLIETLKTLKNARIKYAGAGMDLQEAESPAVIDLGERGRVLVFAFGAETSGIPFSWAATDHRPGIGMLKDLSLHTVQSVKERVGRVKKPRDIVITSIHWGGNWGYDVSENERVFARALIDQAGVDIIHGHSSHHLKGIEVYNGRLILYGCGDFLNDYEGISGYEAFRADLGLMYFAEVNETDGTLMSLRMIPTQVKRFRVHRASAADGIWLRDLLNREGRKFGTAVGLSEDNVLVLRWNR